MRRLISAIWHTLKEPRVITLIMVLVYVLILANGILCCCTTPRGLRSCTRYLAWLGVRQQSLRLAGVALVGRTGCGFGGCRGSGKRTDGRVLHSHADIAALAGIRIRTPDVYTRLAYLARILHF